MQFPAQCRIANQIDHHRFSCCAQLNNLILQRSGIKRVAVDYKNEEGDSLLTLTAPSDTVVRYSDGAIDREQFLQELEGQVNFVEVARILSGELK